MMTDLTKVPPPPAAPDWDWRADFFDQTAAFYENKAEEATKEAKRYRGLAEQARYLHGIGQHR